MRHLSMKGGTVLLLTFERGLWDRGFKLVAGVDEVGRGCLAGDVVAAAVIFPQGLYINGVKDSKQLTGAQREKFNRYILSRSLSVGIGIVNEKVVDQINIRQAARLAMKYAVSSLRIYPDYLLIDGESIDLSLPQEKICKGDCLSHSIAAASIAAKVKRDRMACEWDYFYPQYGFKRNKGYYTKEHSEALQIYGPSPKHRKTFIKNIFGQSFQQITLY